MLHISTLVLLALSVQNTELDPLKLESQKVLRWHELLGTDLISSAKEASAHHH